MARKRRKDLGDPKTREWRFGSGSNTGSGQQFVWPSAQPGQGPSEAIERFVDFCLRQAVDMLSEHVTLLWTLGIVLRMRRDMTGADLDQAMATILAGEQVALERFRRRQWQATLDSADQFQCEPLRRPQSGSRLQAIR